MTQTEQSTILSRISLACRQYHAAFDVMPERILVYFAQKPHLPPYITVPEIPQFSLAMPTSIESALEPPRSGFVYIPIETHTPSKLNWDEFLLYHPKLGRVKPEELVISATLVKKMIEAKGYGVLVNSNHPALDKFYIFQRDRYIPWAFSKFAYECIHMGALKAELEYVLKRFEEGKRD